MKTKIKDILKKIYSHKLAVLIVILLLGAFYWHEVRPSLIKKNCYSIATKKAIDRANKEDQTFTRDDYSFYYSMCQQSRGL
jgi:hypothetical protein